MKGGEHFFRGSSFPAICMCKSAISNEKKKKKKASKGLQRPQAPASAENPERGKQGWQQYYLIFSLAREQTRSVCLFLSQEKSMDLPPC